MSSKVQAIPQGYHTVTPFLSLNNATKAIQFYKDAFGAKEVEVNHSPDGKVMHAVIQIGNSMIMLADEFPQTKCKIASPQSLQGSTTMFNIYVEDVDVMFNTAVKAGAKVIMPVEDAFWGDRYGQLEDPYGHFWSIATHKEDLSEEEISKAAEQLFSKPEKKCCSKDHGCHK